MVSARRTTRNTVANRAKELGVPASALTDHGVLYGAVALVRACTAAGVKLVIGNEMYIVNGDPSLPPADGEEPLFRYHLVVLAKNTAGYRNLVKLTTMVHLHGKVETGSFARLCINKNALFEHRDGQDGEISEAILRGDPDSARNVARWFKDTFGDEFYLEIQGHGSEKDKIVNQELVRIGKELDIKITISVAEKVEEYDLFGATRIPHYPFPEQFEDDPSRYLALISRKGLMERLVVRQKSGQCGVGHIR